jgi:hypothetical protein
MLKSDAADDDAGSENVSGFKSDILFVVVVLFASFLYILRV